MPLNPQTSPFPPIYLPEQGWEHSLRKSVELLYPGQGIRSGLELGFPLTSGGLITTGLTPTLTAGLLVQGDKVYGPLGPKVTAAAAKNLTNKNIYFGLKGLTYGDANNAAPLVTDVLIGSISTDNEATAAIQHMGQQYNYGGCRFGVRGVVNLAKCAKAADTTFFTFTVPNTGLKNVRISYAQARVFETVTAGAAGSDNFVLKAKVGDAAAVSLATLTGTNLAAAAGTIARLAPASAVVPTVTGDAQSDVAVTVTAAALSWYNPTSILFQYNQTDASTNFVGGGVEVMVVMEAF